MRYMFLVPLCLAAACNSDVPGENGNGGGSPDKPNDPGGGSTYPYDGDDPAFVVVNATLDGLAVDCDPVLYDLATYPVAESCGEPIAVAPNVAILVTVGSVDDRCGTRCYAQNQYGGSWNDLPLQVLDDGGKAIGVPQIITPRGGETVEVTVELNQFVQGQWTCHLMPIDYIDSGQAQFEGVETVSMPALGDFTTNGREATPISGYGLDGEGVYTDSFTFHFEGFHSGLGEDIVADCSSDE